MAERLGRGLCRFATSRAAGQNSMYYVYFLKSQVNGDLYIGSCEDVNIRVNRHNSRLVRSTKAYAPWKLVGSEGYTTRSEAVRRERFLKAHQQKEIFKKRFEKD